MSNKDDAFTTCMAFHDHLITAAQFWEWCVWHGYWGERLRAVLFHDFVTLCGGT